MAQALLFRIRDHLRVRNHGVFLLPELEIRPGQSFVPCLETVTLRSEQTCIEIEAHFQLAHFNTATGSRWSIVVRLAESAADLVSPQMQVFASENLVGILRERE